MQKFTKILVPVDFSEASKRALRYGMFLAREFDASLAVAHVVEYSASFARAFPDSSFELEKHRVEEIRERIRTLVPDDVREALSCRFIVKMGDPEDEINGVILDESADLVVMGTHGRRGFKRWVLGSVTEHMLRSVPVPVLTVSHLENDQGSADSLSGGRILYATDLSEASRGGLDLAFGLSERFDADLLVLHVLLPLRLEYGSEYLPLDLRTDHEALHEELSRRLEDSIPEPVRASSRVHWELGEGIAWEVVLDTAEERKVDLIVINLHGKKPPERAFLGPTAERVVRNARQPVLGIPVV